MTDLETVKAMLDRADVKYEVSVDEEAEQTTAGTNLTIKKIYNSQTNRGYTGFFSVFEFDEAGALLSVGSWEG